MLIIYNILYSNIPSRSISVHESSEKKRLMAFSKWLDKVENPEAQITEIQF